MRYSEILLVLPSALAAIHNALPAVREPHLAARQQATMTTTTKADEAQISSCASAYSARSSVIPSLESEQPAPLTSYWSEVYRSATDECGSNIAIQTAAPMSASLSSLQDAWESSVGSYLLEIGYYEPPPGCDAVYESIMFSQRSNDASARATCMSAYSSSTAAAAASRTPAATSAVTTTASAETPANTGAAGRSGVSTSLALGAMTVLGYFGLM
ncbi:hypothetical protein MCOR25_008694 [Pyricularia grisea]|nr:hypothetical protein MCOR25_008694 [Pyricularia grisea]